MAKNNVFVITYDSRIFGVFTEKEKAQDAYDNFEDLFLQYAQEDLPDEFSVSMVEVPLDKSVSDNANRKTKLMRS